MHIDDATIAALTETYRELLPEGGALLDLMSSWVSHLPDEMAFSRITGLGMNEPELARNPRLSDYCVHDLNRDPVLPFEDKSFDAVVNAVSIQYLTRPVDVFRETARVLAPGGLHAVSLSHRCFPTKAIRAWHTLSSRACLDVVRSYFALAGGYDESIVLDRSPAGVDPLWIIAARRKN